MSLFSPRERAIATAVSRLVYCNPFLPERIACERDALGDAFLKTDLVWSWADDGLASRPNVLRLAQVVEELCPVLRARIVDEGVRPRANEAELYEELVMHLLYYRRHAALERLTNDLRLGRRTQSLGGLFGELSEDIAHFLDAADLPGLPPHDPAHLLACFFQIRRAFDQIFRSIVGTSMASAKLRASIWQSVFTHDMRRYRRTLYDKTGDFTTLVTGPSGTGKELVARAIGASRYIPFDAKRKAFTENFAGSFFALNLSALSPMLVESELFGHRRGAFTGAVEDRRGWLEVCPPLGTVFLDEIGELDPLIQVKLLRVLQTRTFERLGDTRTLEFRGKIIAATNRDLADQIDRGEFRRDFYYRLCSDILVTPSLREQIADSPDELRALVRFIATRLLGDDAESLVDQVMQNVDRHLGHDYDWPGNFRELEQCVRNVLIHGEYQAPKTRTSASENGVAAQLASGMLTAQQLLQQYCRHVYSITGSYEAAAKRLGLDRRTVRAHVVAAAAE